MNIVILVFIVIVLLLTILSTFYIQIVGIPSVSFIINKLLSEKLLGKLKIIR